MHPASSPGVSPCLSAVRVGLWDCCRREDAFRLLTIKPRAPCFPARNDAWGRGRRAPVACYQAHVFALSSVRCTIFAHQLVHVAFLTRFSSSLFSGPAVEYNGQTCQGVPTAPPILGQHTNEILLDLLEYSDKDISDLEQDGVIESYIEK